MALMCRSALVHDFGDLKRSLGDLCVLPHPHREPSLLVQQLVGVLVSRAVGLESVVDHHQLVLTGE